MNDQMIARLQRDVRSRKGPALLVALSEVMGGHVQGPIGEQLSDILQRAKGGQLQVFGEVPGVQVVVISMADLATLFQAAADALSFGDVLRQSGFAPVPGRLRLERKQRNRSLKIYGFDGREPKRSP